MRNHRNHRKNHYYIDELLIAMAICSHFLSAAHRKIWMTSVLTVPGCVFFVLPYEWVSGIRCRRRHKTFGVFISVCVVSVWDGRVSVLVTVRLCVSVCFVSMVWHGSVFIAPFIHFAANKIEAVDLLINHYVQSCARDRVYSLRNCDF